MEFRLAYFISSHLFIFFLSAEDQQRVQLIAFHIYYCSSAMIKEPINNYRKLPPAQVLYDRICNLELFVIKFAA